MHTEVLAKKQLELLPLLKEFSGHFGLAGGTAIALHIGHRRSIDFDLFSNKEFVNDHVERTLLSKGRISRVLVDRKGEYTVVVNGVKATFLYFPFKIAFKENFNDIPVADLLTLSALKAYALGRRAKWKDYVDFYFIFRHFLNIEQVVTKAKSIFRTAFNEKLFRAQLSYFDDVDRSEKVIYLKSREIADSTIKRRLTAISLG